jgi:Na+-driven multidrug efflux pump
MTKQYIIIYSIGSIFNSILIVIMSALRAIGNSRIPLVFVGITTIINLGLGVAGAGLATMIAMIVGMIIAITYLEKKKSILRVQIKYLRLNMEYIAKFIKIGVPIVLEEIFAVIGLALEVNTVNQDGMLAIAAYGVADKLIQTVYIIGLSFQTMGTVVTGQFIGSKKIKESTKVIKEGMKLSIFPSILLILIVFVFPKQFCRIFIVSETVIAMAVTYIRIIGILHIFAPIKQLVQGFIAGTGHTKILFYSMMVANIVEIIAIILLRNTNIGSLNVIGIAILLWLMVDLIINMIYFLSRKWEKQTI